MILGDEVGTDKNTREGHEVKFITQDIRGRDINHAGPPRRAASVRGGSRSQSNGNGCRTLDTVKRMKRFRTDGRSASEPEGCAVFHYSVPGNISRGRASPRGGDARSEIHFRTAIEIT